MFLRKSLAVSVVTLVFALGADGHEGEHEHPLPKAVPASEIYKPSAIPDRIVLTWQHDPATSVTVNWRTDTGVTAAFAEIAESDHGPLFINHVTRTTACTQTLETDLGSANYHSAAFSELQPDTKYVYRVGDGANWSEWAQFKTANDSAAPFTFIYFGDAQNRVKAFWSRVVREAFAEAPRSAFMLHAGDLVNRANSDAEWGEWFYASGFIHRRIPCVATPGNHEYGRVKTEDGQSVRALSQHWRPTFAFAENGPEELLETTYWFDYQGVRFVSLNSNRDYDLQAKWLDEVLADNPNKWTIVSFHHPIYSSSAGRDNKTLRATWQPLFEKHQVDLVLQGHDHTYARSKLMPIEDNVASGVTHQERSSGTVYVVSVSGPKMYTLERRPEMQRVAEDTQLFQVIRIDGEKLHYEARTAMGSLYDAFTLEKQEGKPNTLTDQIPELPERRR